MRPLADYHTHTRWSHARGSVEDNLRAAEAIGLEAVGIAEHGPSMLFIGVAQRRWPLLAEKIAAHKGSSTRLLFNIEPTSYPWREILICPPMWRSDRYVAGRPSSSCQYQGPENWWTYGLRWLSLLSRRQRHKLYDAYTEALINCVERHPVDIVVHPGYRLPIDSACLAAACAAGA